MGEENSDLNSIELATELTIAWLNNPNNRAAADEVPAFLQRMHATLNSLSAATSGEERASSPQMDYAPAVSPRKSLASPEHIISLIDGKPYKTLRRHLAGHGLTPDQYRDRYKLKADYPMVAPNYSEHRRAMAHKIGLGSKGRQAKAAQPASDTKPAKAGRAPRQRAPKSE